MQLRFELQGSKCRKTLPWTAWPSKCDLYHIVSSSLPSLRRRVALVPDDPHVATSLNNLALLYDHQGKYTDAEPLFKHALAIDRTRSSPRASERAQFTDTHWSAADKC